MQMNLNPNKNIARHLVILDLTMHLDQSGRETYLMEWLKSPPDQPLLFGNMGISVPQILDGYCGWESQFTNYCKETLVEIANLRSLQYTLQSYPTNVFEIHPKNFTADRHAEGKPFGWMVGNCSYPSGVTAEHRETWTTDLIPQTEGFYPDVGSNYVRNNLSEEMIADKTLARKIEDRRKLAWKKYGKMAGEPGLAFLIKRYPYIARMRVILPGFHGRGHVSSYFAFICLIYLHKFGSEHYNRLKKEFDEQQSNIAIGRLATSGTRLFNITKQIAREFGDCAAKNGENLLHRTLPILLRRLLEITYTTNMPSNRELAEHRVVGGLYWTHLCYVSKEFVKRKLTKVKEIRGGLK